MASPTPIIDSLKKRAKALLSAHQSSSPDALARVHVVYHDPVVTLALQQAQHVIAQEHGFSSWQTLITASDVDIRLAITMTHEPLLTDFGIGIYNKRRTSEDYEAEFAQQRADLRAKAKDVAWCIDWLKAHVASIKTINERHTSYGLKHLAEPFHPDRYLTNGVFIAAGITAGYTYRISSSPNVSFGMSERSLNTLRKQANG